MTHTWKVYWRRVTMRFDFHWGSAMAHSHSTAPCLSFSQLLEWKDFPWLLLRFLPHWSFWAALREAEVPRCWESSSAFSYWTLQNSWGLQSQAGWNLHQTCRMYPLWEAKPDWEALWMLKNESTEISLPGIESWLCLFLALYVTLLNKSLYGNMFPHMLKWSSKIPPS